MDANVIALLAQLEAQREELYAPKKGMVTIHVRQPLPRKGGNSFYRDKNDYTKFAKTLCGAPVTEYDTNLRDVTTKKAQAYYATSDRFTVCVACKQKAGIK